MQLKRATEQDQLAFLGGWYPGTFRKGILHVLFASECKFRVYREEENVFLTYARKVTTNMFSHASIRSSDRPKTAKTPTLGYPLAMQYATKNNHPRNTHFVYDRNSAGVLISSVSELSA